MKIQINTDRNVEGNEALAVKVEADLHEVLQRFEDRLTRVEVHLGDTDGEKQGGTPDKRCLIEARPEGLQPVVVTALAITVEQACHDAARKMQSLLTSTFGRLDDRDATATIRRPESS